MTITRRHHPLLGQQFAVLIEGRKQLAIRLPDGTSMRIPRNWTDMDGEPVDEAPSVDMVFTTQALRELIDLIEVIKRD